VSVTHPDANIFILAVGHPLRCFRGCDGTGKPFGSQILRGYVSSTVLSWPLKNPEFVSLSYARAPSAAHDPICSGKQFASLLEPSFAPYKSVIVEGAHSSGSAREPSNVNVRSAASGCTKALLSATTFVVLKPGCNILQYFRL